MNTNDRLIRGRKVLVVEDEVMVSWLLEDMLTDLGCAVIGPAARVVQALDLIDHQAIDAAVLDVNLDGETSYPIADALMARGVPFFFSTGYDRDRLPATYRNIPVLQKPFHASAIGATLAGLFLPQPLDHRAGHA